MSSFSFFSLLLLLLVNTTNVSAEQTKVAPRIDPAGEVVIRPKDGDSFMLTCEGSETLHWNWTTGLPGNQATIEETIKTDILRPFTSTLEVKEPIFGDTGFYRCHYKDATNLVTDKDRAASTYVYVYEGAETSIFVNGGNTAVFVKTNEKLILECNTTLPDARVTLTFNDEDITSQVLWDPKTGFVKLNVKVHDAGLYKCRAEDFNQEKIIHVQVLPSTVELPEPTIEVGPGQFFVVDHPFTLNCTFLKGDLTSVVLRWTYPNAEAKYNVTNATEVKDEDTLIISTLHVPAATSQDSGTYTCSATASTHGQTEHSRDIHVQDSMASFVNISSSDTLTVNAGDTMEWRAEVTAFPPTPSITYWDWRGDALHATHKLSMWYDPYTSSSWLRILNVTSYDFGQYTLTAITSDRAAVGNASVTIQVKSAPDVQIRGLPSYLTPGSDLNLSCMAQGFPLPDLTWEFESCLNDPSSCYPDNNVVSEGPQTHPEPGNLVKSQVNLRPSLSGLLTCAANNSIGALNKTLPVTLSDINGLFVFRHTGLNVTTELTKTTNPLTIITNDDFAIECGANKLHYRSVELLVPRGAGLEVNSSETQFSLLKEVATVRVTRSLEGRYTCSGQPHDEKLQTEVKQVDVVVLDEVLPMFLQDSNMAKNSTMVVKENQPYFLNCTVGGTPPPLITWRKDEEPLTADSEFFDGKTTILSEDMQRLELKFVFKDKHIGEYSCSAKNRVGTVTGTLTLSVPGGGLNKSGQIALATTLIGIVILAFIVVLLLRRVKTERRFRKSFRQNELWLFEKGNVGQLNPDCPADEQAELLPYGREWEVDRDRITIGKQLGSGAFGRVVKASVTGIEGPAATTVAIKMCKSQADASQVRALTLELKIMIHLGKHLNIVNLMGANTTQIGKGELWILVEYCRFGNLLVFMHRHRRNFINQINPETGRIDHSITTLNPAAAMSPLSPLSPGASPWQHPQVTSTGSHDGFAATPSTPLILSAPPPGHHQHTTGPQSTPSGHQVHNPLYNATIGSQAAGEHRPGRAQSPDAACCDRDSRGTTQGSVKSDGRTQNSYLASLSSSGSSRAPLSPRESGLGDAGLLDSHGQPFIHEAGSVPGVNAPFTTGDLICWAWQVAQGMDYLASRKVLHGDLAARNLLLADDNVVKISDFGLSREMYKKNVYMKKGDDLMPIKWMSVEAIRDRIFSVQSDVWAFGVTLWEIFSLGSNPYPGIEVDQEFLKLLEGGYRMETPKYANQEIYNLLLSCWKPEPQDRPSFSQAAETLGDLLLPDVKGGYMSMNDQYIQMNEERFREETDYLNMCAQPHYANMMTAKTDDEEDAAAKPHYINMQGLRPKSTTDPNGNNRGDPIQSSTPGLSIRSPEAVGYCNMTTFSPPPQTSTPPPSSSKSHYLPMEATRRSISPLPPPFTPQLEDDVFSPTNDDASKFTFSQDREGIQASRQESNPFLTGAESRQGRISDDTERSKFLSDDK